jgi:hypothetical protein
VARAGERDEEAARALAHVSNVILPRLERLCWLEPGVDALAVEAFRIRVREAAEDLQAPDLASRVDALETDLAAFQHATVGAIAHDIYVNGWNYGGPSLDGLREVSERPATCPNCARDRAAVITMTHVVHAGLTVRTLQCRRCGDLWWTSEESDDQAFMLEGALDVRHVVEADPSGAPRAPAIRRGGWRRQPQHDGHSRDLECHDL